MNLILKRSDLNELISCLGDDEFESQSQHHVIFKDVKNCSLCQMHDFNSDFQTNVVQ